MKKLFLGFCLLSSFLHGAEEYQLVITVQDTGKECMVVDDMIYFFDDWETTFFNFETGQQSRFAIAKDGVHNISPIAIATYENEIGSCDGIARVGFKAVSEKAALYVTNNLIGHLSDKKRHIIAAVLSTKQSAGNWKSVAVSHADCDPDYEKMYGIDQSTYVD